MLYKVTPMMAPPVGEKVKKPREPGQPRKKRKSAVFDHEHHEVLITLMCLKCKQIKPLMQFGLRKMADGAIRNQPWCRGCRSGAGAKKPAAGHPSTEASAPVAQEGGPPSIDPAPSAPALEAAPFPSAAEAEERFDSAEGESVSFEAHSPLIG